MDLIEQYTDAYDDYGWDLNDDYEEEEEQEDEEDEDEEQNEEENNENEEEVRRKYVIFMFYNQQKSVFRRNLSNQPWAQFNLQLYFALQIIRRTRKMNTVMIIMTMGSERNVGWFVR